MKRYAIALVAVLAGQACARAPSGPAVLTVMTHDSFAVSDSVVKAFEQETGAHVQFLPSGDAGAALNRAILARQQPLADVFYGVDNTFLSRALDEDIFEPYDSPVLPRIPPTFDLDPSHRAVPIDFGDVCLNYDISYFEAHGLAVPDRLEDLTDPAYRGLLVVENAATSSPGLAFLLATIGHFGEAGYLNYWRALRANDLLVVNDWESAYYNEFSGASAEGTYPLVVSYGSSPPFEVIYADPPVTKPGTGAITADDMCFRQIEFVGILQGTQQRDLARRWVDFMLSVTFQEDMPLQMFVFPVNPEAKLDPTFEAFLAIPEHPAQVEPQAIAAHREKWIEDWTEAVLR
jgi:thiamine transport system substrate-binding protein